MTASSEPPKPSHKAKKKLPVRTHTPRPDELSLETFEFIAAVDEYKRRHLRSFLDDAEVLAVLLDLGYRREDVDADAPTEGELDDFARERERYRVEQGRLFPTWSELFELLAGLGYRRRDDAA